MAINYDKWNKIDEYSSEDNEDNTPLSYIKNSNSNKIGKLLTIPWDTSCGNCWIIITSLFRSSKLNRIE